MRAGSEPASRVRRAWPAVVVSVGGMITALDLMIVNVALPQVAADYGAGLTELQWVVNAYTLALAALLLTAGALSDRLGGWSVFVTGVVIFVAASVGCAGVSDIGSLIMFRAVQGVGGALIVATSVALIARTYSGSARVTAIGVYVTLGTAAANLGPLVGGLLVDSTGWRGIFLINVPIGLLVLLGVVALPAPPPLDPAPRRPLDPAGATLAVAALFGVNYALLTGAAQGWTRPDVLGALVLAVLAAAAFVGSARRKGDAAMVDLRLLALPSFSGALALGLLTRVVTFGMLPFLVLWLQGVAGLTATQTGLALLTMSGPVLLTALLAGPLQRRFPVRTLIATASALGVLGALLLLRISPSGDWTDAVPAFVAIGLGSGLGFPPLLGIAVGAVPPDRAGMASGMTTTFLPVGTAAGVGLFGALTTLVIAGAGLPPTARDATVAGRIDAVDPSLADAARAAFVDGVHAVAVVMALLSAVCVVLAVVLLRNPGRAGSST